MFEVLIRRYEINGFDMKPSKYSVMLSTCKYILRISVQLLSDGKKLILEVFFLSIINDDGYYKSSFPRFKVINSNLFM